MTTSRATTKQKEVRRIVEALSRAITQHRLPPGTRLVEAQIVDSLKANRNHVQSALQRLALLKIITIEPNRGAQVSRPSVQEAQDVLATRRAIERGVVESITPQQVANFRSRIDTHLDAEAAATSAGDRQAMISSFDEFHRLLGKICGNAELANILDTLMVRSALISALYLRDNAPSCQHNSHRKILQALEGDDRNGAVSLILQLLDQLESELKLEDNKTDINLHEALSGL